MDLIVIIVMQRKVHVLIYKGDYEKDGANGGKIKIEKFYEIYNGCRIATIVGENLVYLTELSYFKVNGRLFITSTSLQPLAYNENKIYSIYDATQCNGYRFLLQFALRSLSADFFGYHRAYIHRF